MKISLKAIFQSLLTSLPISLVIYWLIYKEFRDTGREICEKMSPYFYEAFRGSRFSAEDVITKVSILNDRCLELANRHSIDLFLILIFLSTISCYPYFKSKSK